MKNSLPFNKKWGDLFSNRSHLHSPEFRWRTHEILSEILKRPQVPSKWVAEVRQLMKFGGDEIDAKLKQIKI